jgi:cysteine synthase A
MTLHENIIGTIGQTPLVKLHSYSSEGNLFAKLESFNPGSSVKDRIAKAMIEDAEKSGLLKKDSVIIEPTSGNTGIGLATVAAAKGYPLILTMPESMSQERRAILRFLGAKIILTPKEKGMTGAIAKANEIAEETTNPFIPSQFANPSNPQIHATTTAVEIIEDLGGAENVDIIVAGVGTGGTVSGIGRALKEHNPDVKIIAVEPEESAVLSGGAPGPHGIQGLGAGFVPDNYHTNYVDEVLQVNAQQSLETSRQLATDEGILVGISAGGALCVARKVADENPGKNVVVVLPDSAERYISTALFDEETLSGELVFPTENAKS